MSRKIKKKRTRAHIDPPWTPFVPGIPMDLGGGHFAETWVNSRFQVIVSELVRDQVDEAAERWPRMIHLSIRREDRKPINDWRDLQRLKNELCGTNTEAVELYPAERRLVDAANQYHLYVLEPGFEFPFGYPGRDCSADEGWEPPEDSEGAVQRKHAPIHLAAKLPAVGPVWASRLPPPGASEEE